MLWLTDVMRVSDSQITVFKTRKKGLRQTVTAEGGGRRSFASDVDLHLKSTGFFGFCHSRG